MATNKTMPSGIAVETYLAAISDPERQADCRALARLMAEVTGEPGRMWGSSIVGFGSYHYRYESGREGDSCLAGFSSRANEIALYLVADFPGRDELLARLGKHRSGKGCLYLKRLADVDSAVLRELVARSVRQRQENHG
jgi:hypothetical protein